MLLFSGKEFLYMSILIKRVLLQEKSPYMRDRERSHDREGRDKQYPFKYSLSLSNYLTT